MTQFHYPSFADSYPKLSQRPWHRKWLKQLGYQLQTSRHATTIRDFVAFVNADPRRVALLTQAPRIGTAFYEGYVLRQWTFQQRLAAIKADLHFAERYLPPAFFDSQRLTLATLDNGLRIELKRNDLSMLEGLWHVGLYANEQRVYLFTFTAGQGNQLLIGSIQGASNDGETQQIKKVTKAMHGLRPQQLMIWLAQALAKQLDLAGVTAMGNDNHPRMSWKKRLRNQTIFIADYDKIWQSYHGQVQGDGNWCIPPMTLKSLEEIASKKRSMYRKRYAMLDAIQASMQAVFADAPCGSHSSAPQ